MAPTSPDPAHESQRVVLLHLCVSFNPEAATALAEAAALAGISRTALVRRIVAEWLREQQRPTAAPAAAGPPPE